jgi:hypothetical protein
MPHLVARTETHHRRLHRNAIAVAVAAITSLSVVATGALAHDDDDDDDDYRGAPQGYVVAGPRYAPPPGYFPPAPPLGYGQYGYPRAGYRQPGYQLPPPVVVPAPVIAAPPVVIVQPLRPASCGQYRYWDGEVCADARWRPPYIGPRW